jgi:hypothetical protein
LAGSDSGCLFVFSLNGGALLYHQEIVKTPITRIAISLSEVSILSDNLVATISCIDIYRIATDPIGREKLVPKLFKFADYGISDIASIGPELNSTALPIQFNTFAKSIIQFDYTYRFLCVGSPFLSLQVTSDQHASHLSSSFRSVTFLAKSLWSDQNIIEDNNCLTLNPLFVFDDEPRKGIQIIPAPQCPMGKSQFALISDNLGRITLLDICNFEIVRMWKGARNAQFSWVQLCDDSKDRAVILLILIYLPRGVLEVYTTSVNTRILIQGCKPGMKLIQSQENASEHFKPAKSYFFTNSEVLGISFNYDDVLKMLERPNSKNDIISMIDSLSVTCDDILLDTIIARLPSLDVQTAKAVLAAIETLPDSYYVDIIREMAKIYQCNEPIQEAEYKDEVKNSIQHKLFFISMFDQIQQMKSGPITLTSQKPLLIKEQVLEFFDFDNRQPNSLIISIPELSRGFYITEKRLLLDHKLDSKLKAVLGQFLLGAILKNGESIESLSNQLHLSCDDLIDLLKAVIKEIPPSALIENETSLDNFVAVVLCFYTKFTNQFLDFFTDIDQVIEG